MVSKRADPNYHQISGHIPKEMATEFSGNQRIVSRTFPELELTATQVLEAR
ncbi:MAG: hypothetical protein F6K31_14515 [Symploca sp. SIO2G7]|nr:hypothetical protein [Symploca sp. SIO2G7]